MAEGKGNCFGFLLVLGGERGTRFEYLIFKWSWCRDGWGNRFRCLMFRMGRGGGFIKVSAQDRPCLKNRDGLRNLYHQI